MAINGFDYKGFAQNLAQQAFELIPADFNDMQKNYVANTLLNFSTIAGQSLYDEGQFDLDTAIMITQIIAEWSYHKSVDLVRSGIPQQYWDPVMQKIAFTIFEIAKNAFGQNLPQDQILQLIEHHVKKTYLDCVAELKDKNLIDEGLMEQAASQSNIDAMQQQMQQEEQQQQAAAANQGSMPAQGNNNIPMPQSRGLAVPPGTDTKILKLATLALLFQKVKQEKVQTILNKFDPNDAQSVIKFMEMPDLGQKVDASVALRCLQEIRTNLPKSRLALSPSKVVAKVQNISQYVQRPQLEQMLKLERPKVKKFVFNALEGEYYEIPPKVANIIATHIEDGV
jgi:hypothetical protein